MTLLIGLKCLLAASATTLLASTCQAVPGYSYSHIAATEERPQIAVHVWYPTNADGIRQMIGSNPAFKGTQVAIDAMPKPGRHPVIVMSHGSGGNAVNLGWIAGHLADLGIVVLAPNHPGTTSGDSSPEKTLKLWQRPADLATVLDKAQSLLPDGLVIDTHRVGVMGFSLGGYSALSVAGARVSKQAYIDYCEQRPRILDCGWFSSHQVSLHSIDKDRYEQDNRDVRFRFAIAIDPALVHAMRRDSLQSIKVPVQLINLGEPGKIPAAVDANVIFKPITTATIDHVEHANHFSFLGQCTANGEKIMKQDGEEPICSEPSQQSRGETHRQLQRLIGKFALRQLDDLKSGPVKTAPAAAK